jgi:type IV secretory pathway TraG/TraD family ATPase VirD4
MIIVNVLIVALFFAGLGGLVILADRLAKRLRAGAAPGAHVRGARMQSSPGTPATQDASQIMIGPVPIPAQAETTHIMIAGATGAGKSLAINRIFLTVVQRCQPAVCVDPGGGLLERFYNPARGDIILNPLDARSHAWDLFSEIEGPWDCPRLAASLCPSGGGDSNREWSGYAQSLLAALLSRMTGSDMQEMVRLATAADAAELAAYVQGKPAAALTAKGADKMLASVRAILGSRLAPWEFMPTDHPRFSFRNWLTAPRGMIWLPSRADQRSLLAPLYGSMCGAFSTGLLSCSEDLQRRVWMFLDEAPSLGPIEGLERLLAEGRKFGASCVLGFQDISQIRSTYGREGAQTLASVMRTKLLMAQEDPESADYYSKMLGQREIIRPQKSVNESGSSTTYQHATEQVVLPSELMGLGVGVGYLKVAGDPTIKKVRVPIPNLPPKQHPAFLR